jgi:hypothetical protein
MPIVDAHLSSRRTFKVPRFMQPSCPKIPDMDQLVQLSRKGVCNIHNVSTILPHSSPHSTRVRPSFTVFVPESQNQHLPACHLSAPAPTPGSLLHAFARRGESRRRCVSVKAVSISNDRIGQNISNVSRRAASLPAIGCVECRRIRSKGKPSLDLRLERLRDVRTLIWAVAPDLNTQVREVCAIEGNRVIFATMDSHDCRKNFCLKIVQM